MSLVRFQRINPFIEINPLGFLCRQYILNQHDKIFLIYFSLKYFPFWALSYLILVYVIGGVSNSELVIINTSILQISD